MKDIQKFICGALLSLNCRVLKLIVTQRHCVTAITGITMPQIKNELIPIFIWVAMLALAAIFASDFKSGYYSSTSHVKHTSK
jgi:hypothetical protein